MIEVCKCKRKGVEEYHLRKSGMTKKEAEQLASTLNAEQLSAPSSGHISEVYTLAEIKAQIASHMYSAELLLQHAMIILDNVVKERQK